MQILQALETIEVIKGDFSLLLRKEGRKEGRKGREQKTEPANLVAAPQPPPLKTTTKFGSEASKVIAVYCESFKKRYGVNPTLDGKAVGILKSLSRELGTQRAIDCCSVYLQMGDQWFVTRNHDVATLKSNLTKVGAALDSGRDLSVTHKKTETFVSQRDRAHQELNEKIEKGEI